MEFYLTEMFIYGNIVLAATLFLYPQFIVKIIPNTILRLKDKLFVINRKKESLLKNEEFVNACE